jgi:[ribosomal protein S5]-alanine N-acetyltransferase
MDRPPFPEFETARLRIRGLRAGDEEFLVSLDTDPRVMEHIHEGPMTLEEAMKWARLQVEMAGMRWHWGKWIVELKDSGERVGWVEFGKLSGRDRDDLQLGYQFAPAHWGHGYATEACARIMEYAFTEMELDRVAAIARPANVVSQRVLEKLGFRKQGGRRDDGRVWCDLLFAEPAAKDGLDEG